MRKTLSSLFKSNARVIYVKNFRKGFLRWNKLSDKSFEHSFSCLNTPEVYPRFPVILQSNGLPWDIGNSYLVGQLDKPNLSELSTLTDRATHLKFYLQYLEDTEQHYLDLPRQYSERVTQKFKLFVKNVLDTCDFSAEHLNNILSTVSHFYTNILYDSLVDEKDFTNEPFTAFQKTVMFTNNVGLNRSFQIKTNDLRIRSSRSQYAQPGMLRDGGRLRPLSVAEQQEIQLRFVNGFASIELELMIKVALETGARQQTVCTLSIRCIRAAFDELEVNPSQQVVTINAGHRFDADTKGGRLNRLIFQRQLISELIVYIDSERAERRRLNKNNFYSDSDDNYVFLTRDGNPYYTAQREVVHRQAPSKKWNISAPPMVPKSGQSLRTELTRFIQRIQNSNPDFKDFRFHDLRATMGMNLVRLLRHQKLPESRIFDHVRQRLNHRDLKVTEAYLNFDSELSEFNEIQEAFGESMFSAKPE